MTFGRRVKSLRLSKKLSISELARRSGIARSTLSDIESGRRVLGEKVYIPLCQSLDVSLMFLISGEESPTEDILRKIHELENTIDEIKELLTNPSKRTKAFL